MKSTLHRNNRIYSYIYIYIFISFKQHTNKVLVKFLTTSSKYLNIVHVITSVIVFSQLNTVILSAYQFLNVY